MASNIFGSRDPQAQGIFGREAPQPTQPTAPQQPTFGTAVPRTSGAPQQPGGVPTSPAPPQPTTGPFPAKPGNTWSQGPDGAWTQGAIPEYSTPVTSTGLPAPPTAGAAPAPQAAAPAAPPAPMSLAEAGPDPFTAFGGGVFVPGVGWVPQGHPLALQYLSSNPAMGAGGGQLPANPYQSQIDMARQTGVDPYAYQQGGIAATLPGMTYTPGETAQFAAPDQGQIEAELQQALLHLLQNPELFNPQQVAGLKEASKEQALQMQRDSQTALGENAASRGVSLPVGEQQRIADTTQSNLLGSYRDIDLQTSQANLDARRQALQLASGLTSEQLGRSVTGYQATLAGQAQAEANKQAAVKAAMDRFFQTWQTGLQGKQLDLQQQLGQGDLDLQRQQLAQRSSEFDKTFPLNEASTLNNILLSRLGFGLNLAQFQQQGQGGLLDFLSRIGS